MPSKDLAQLIAWIGQHFGEIGEIRRVLDSLDRIPNEWKNIARLYMGISADDRSDARKIVDIASNAMGDEDSRSSSSPPHQPRHRTQRPVQHPPIRSYPRGELLAESVHSSFCIMTLS